MYIASNNLHQAIHKLLVYRKKNPYLCTEKIPKELLSQGSKAESVSSAAGRSWISV